MLTNRNDITWLGCSMFVAMLFCLGQVVAIRAVVAVAIALFFMMLIKMPKAYFFAVILFFLPWSPLMKWQADGYSFYTVGIVLFFLYLVGSSRKKEWFHMHQLLVVTGLVSYTLIVKLLNSYTPSLSYWMFVFMCLCWPIYVRHFFRELSFERCIIYLAFGISTAGFAAKWLMDVPHLQYFIKVTSWDAMSLTRFSGFFGDANFYAAHILAAIGGLLVVMLRQQFTGAILCIVLVLLLLYLGFLSVSKMFIILLAVMFGIWLITVFSQRGPMLSKVGVVAGFCLAIVFFMTTEVFAEQLKMYSVRFQMVSNVASFTTGRSDIFGDYIRYFQQQPLSLWLGQGFTDVYKGQVKSAAHNTLLQVLYQFGLFGSVLLAVWLWQLAEKQLQLKHLRETGLVLLVAVGCFGSWLALDSLFADEFFLMPVLLLVGWQYLLGGEA